jgi:hypothetical protein
MRQHADFARTAALHNQVAESLEHTMGVPVARVQIPQSLSRGGNVVTHNISVNNSVVGAINSGTAQRLIVSLREIKQGGAGAAAEQMERLLETVYEAQDLSKEQRAEAIELLSAIAEQMARPADDRQPAMIKVVIEKLDDLLSLSAKCASIWSAICATLKMVSAG